MNPLDFLAIILLALGLSMDAFAVAVCQGLEFKKVRLKHALVIGLYFGIFQAAMPLIGYFAVKWFTDGAFAGYITAFDHWVAFALLAVLGGKMILESFKKEGCADRPCPENYLCGDRECPGGKPPEKKEASLSPKRLLPLALATSIDALAVGIVLAIDGAEIFSSIAVIGVVTLSLAMAGVKIGNVFGAKLKTKAELFGGVILILIGFKILLEHLLG